MGKLCPYVSFMYALIKKKKQLIFKYTEGVSSQEVPTTMLRVSFPDIVFIKTNSRWAQAEKLRFSIGVLPNLN